MSDGEDSMLRPSQQEFFEYATGASKVSVYRQAKGEHIEYTMYFWKDDKKWRADFVEPLATFNDSVLDGEVGYAQEWYMVGRAVEIINQGAYVDAHNAIGAEDASKS